MPDNFEDKEKTNKGSKPAWLKKKLPRGPQYESVRQLISNAKLHTVCQEARCPNQWECFAKQTATFLILGNTCTRDCQFCAVSSGRPKELDPDEPLRVAQSAAELGLKYVVITSVTRDDLADGGAAHYAATITALRKNIQDVHVEVLIPDFGGNTEALHTVLQARPTVLNHNIETVPRLYATVRPQASYLRSLALLKKSHELNSAIPVKSGLMLGLGEKEHEITALLIDLLDNGCSLLTIGQYLQPTAAHLPVSRYIPPDEFEKWQKKAMAMGFKAAACGPFTRSSYKASEMISGVDSAPLEAAGAKKASALQSD